MPYYGIPVRRGRCGRHLCCACSLSTLLTGRTAHTLHGHGDPVRHMSHMSPDTDVSPVRHPHKP
eukprot:3019670-Prymnesium_polylepis.1